jgi:anti-anti-sigma regulatory factor
MEIQGERNVSCEILSPKIRVVRFARPDLRAEMDLEPIEKSPLYRELDARALTQLASGETLLVNLGLIEWYNSAFHRLMLKLREAVLARKARLVLCCLTHPIVKEGFDLMGGNKVFEVAASERQAVDEVKK